jgi:hypothetical protein
LKAACANTRIIEDMLSENVACYGNVHLYVKRMNSTALANKIIRITIVFNSLCVHIIQLRKSQNTTQNLSANRAQLCLLGLRELQRTWDVSNWVLQLFLQFLDQSTARKLRLIDMDRAISPQLQERSTRDQSGMSSLELGAYSGFQHGESSFPTASQGLEMFANMEFSHAFSTREIEDFSRFQLQPDLLNGDIFGGGLDRYYNSVGFRDDNINKSLG